jgi:hypothetical protein
MALLPSLCWGHHQYCVGVVTLVAPRCCPYCTDLFTLTSHGHCQRLCTGVVAPVKLTCVCTLALLSLPLSRWHCCPWCTGISALVMQASLPLLCLCRAVDLQASLPLLSWHVLRLSRGQHQSPRRRQRQHQRNKGNDASTTRAAMPAQ